MPDYSPMISLANVRFSYDGRGHTVFEDLSLDIPGGALTALLGPNGSGKTTLLHLILGVLAPASGVVLLAKRPRQHYTRRDIGKLMGLVLQDEYIPFNFSVMEYVLLGRAPHLHLLQTPSAEDREVAEEALSEVGMLEMRERPIQSLSGGERQLVMIARALAQRPRILLLDEPTSHLDLSNKGRVLRIMRRLADRGVTVVFTTHEPALAADVAEFVVLLRRGRVLSHGPMREALTSAHLSATYDVPVEVVEVAGRRVILPPSTTPEVAATETIPMGIQR